MDNVKKIFKNSLISTWILSYACLILITLAILCFAYIQTHRLIRDEIISTNDIILNQIKDSIDENINNIEIFAGTAPLNERIVKMSRVRPEGMTPEQRYELIRIMRDLSMVSAVAANFESYYIYFENLDTIVSSIGVMSTEIFYAAYGLSVDMTYDEWLSLISKDSGQSLITYSDSENAPLYYVSKMPMSFGAEAANTSIVVTMRREELFSQAKKIESLNSSMIAMVDYNNRFISSDMGSGDFKISYEELPDKKGLLNNEIDKRRYIVSYITSSYWNMKYISVIPNTVFWRRLSDVTVINVAGFVLLFLLGGLFTAYFVKKNYDPIGNLVKRLEKHQDVKKPFDYATDEYNYINTALSAVIGEKEKLAEHFSGQAEHQKNQLIAKMLTSSGESPVPIHEALSMYGVNFLSDEFSVIMLQVEDANSLFSDDEMLDLEGRQKIIHFIIQNVVEEMVNQNNLGYVIELHGSFVCLINYREKPKKQESAQEILRIYKETSKFLKEQFDLSFIFSASRPHQTITGAGQAYSEAASVMDYKIIMGNKSAVFIDEIGDIARTGDYYYPFEQEQMILNVIRLGNYDKAMLLIKNIFDKNLTQIVPSILLARCLMYDLVGTIIKAVKGSGEENDEFLDELDPLKRLEMCEAVHEMTAGMQSLVYDACNYMSGKNVENNSLKSRVTKYIDENYTDINLSVTKIADQIGLNAAYVSVTYKEQAGIGILEYINKIRIGKSVEILKGQSLKISDVSTMVGYASIQSFNRAFKKYFGISPAQFKDSNSM